MRYHYLLQKQTGLPRSVKTVWKMKKNPGQGKVREFHFSRGNLEKNGKKSEIFYPKKLIVNMFLEIYIFNIL